METRKLAWKRAAVLICNKCGKCIKDSPDNLADVLKNKLRKELKAKDLHKEIRVMTSSCLDICEKGFQAVAIIPSDPTEKSRVRVIDYEKDYEDLKEEILNL